jgi:hypothetical protein
MATTLDHKQGAVADIHRRAAKGTFGWAEGNPCRYCGRRFSDALGRRRHERRTHELQPSRAVDLDGGSIPGDLGLDSLDDPRLSGAELRAATHRRLRRLTGMPEEP